MKLFILLLFITAFEITNAQVAKTSWSFGFGGTYPRFMSTDLRSLDLNYGGYISLQRNFSEIVAFRVLGGGYVIYGKVPGDKFYYTDGTKVPPLKEKVHSILIAGNFDLLLYVAPCSPVSPYFLFGLGVVRYDNKWGSDIVNPAAVPNNTVQINFGAGCEWSLSNVWKLKTEVSFHTIESNVDGIIVNNRNGWIRTNADLYGTFDLGLNYYFSLGEPSRYCDLYEGISSETPTIKPATREDVEEIVKANIPKEVIKEIVVEKPVEKENIIPIQSGWRLNGINFETAKARITTESFPVLYFGYLILEEHPEIKVEIQGHTDDIGSDDYNLALSEARAKAVFDYLVRRGINPSRLTVKGYGESKPVADNTSPENRTLNRRIEFKIVE